MTITRRTMLAGTALAATATTLAGARQARAQASGTLQIPMIMPFSGPVAVVSNFAKQGAEITADLINKKGGVAGRKLEFTYMDDRGRPDESNARVREALAAGHKLITGAVLYPSILAMTPALTENNAVLVACGGTGATLSHENFSRNVFPGIENDYFRARSMALLAVQKFPDVSTWGAVISDSANWIEGYANFTKFAGDYYREIGKKVSFADPVLAKLGTSDMRNQINQLQAAPIDGLWNLVAGGDGIALWQQGRAVDLGKKFKVVLDQSLDFILMKTLKQAIPANLWALCAWNFNLYKGNALADEFYKEVLERTKDPIPSGFMQYGNVMASVVSALLTATKGSMDGAALINTLEGLTIPTIKGDFVFRKEDHLWTGDINFVNARPADADPGFQLVDGFKVDGRAIAQPANPGKPFKL